jgi:hypothetical protein
MKNWLIGSDSDVLIPGLDSSIGDRIDLDPILICGEFVKPQNRSCARKQIRSNGGREDEQRQTNKKNTIQLLTSSLSIFIIPDHSIIIIVITFINR